MRKTLLSCVVFFSMTLASEASFAAEGSTPGHSPHQEAYQKEKSEAVQQLRTYMQRLEEDAKREGGILLEKYGTGRFAEAVTRSQNLVEDGKYAEAANILSGLITPNIASDWKGMLKKRIEILNKWATPGAVDLVSYRAFHSETGPHWFHERTKPMVLLWRMDHLPEAGKLFLIADLRESGFLCVRPRKTDRGS